MSLLSRSKATSTSHSSLMASMMVVMPCLCTQSTSCSVWTGGWGRWPLVRLLLVSCDGQRAPDVAASHFCLCHTGGPIESFFDEWVARGEEMEAGSELQCLSAILGLFQLKSTHFNSHLTRTVDRLSLPGRAYTCTSLIQSSCHSQGVASSVPESSPADSSQEQSFSYIMSEIRIPTFKSFYTFDHCDC